MINTEKFRFVLFVIVHETDRIWCRWREQIKFLRAALVVVDHCLCLLSIFSASQASHSFDKARIILSLLVQETFNRPSEQKIDIF